jgi:hypothetical protein
MRYPFCLKKFVVLGTFFHFFAKNLHEITLPITRLNYITNAIIIMATGDFQACPMLKHRGRLERATLREFGASTMGPRSKTTRGEGFLKIFRGILFPRAAIAFQKRKRKAFQKPSCPRSQKAFAAF